MITEAPPAPARPCAELPAWPWVSRLENVVALLALSCASVLPVIEVASRSIGGTGVPGAIVLVQHLTLWIALAGAVLAVRGNQLLALSTVRLLPPRWQTRAHIVTSAAAATVTAALVAASIDFVRIERAAGDEVALGLPAWLVHAVLPIGFATMLARIVGSAGPSWGARATATVGAAVPIALVAVPPEMAPALVMPVLVALAALTILGMPIFAGIGGAALILLWGDGTPINAVPGETYRSSTSLGLVTVSGSIGLLFFPSLPVFLYGFYANQPFGRLFVGGLVAWDRAGGGGGSLGGRAWPRRKSRANGVPSARGFGGDLGR